MSLSPERLGTITYPSLVIPAKAGIHGAAKPNQTVEVAGNADGEPASVLLCVVSA